MKTNVKDTLLTEVNRMREIMGMSLLMEGNIYDEISDLFTRIGRESMDRLSKEEKDMVNRLISRSSEIQNLGIRSIDDLINNPSARQDFLTILKNNKSNIINSLKRGIDEYAEESIRRINLEIERNVPTLKTMMGNAKTTNGSVLDMLKTIETQGITSYKPQTLIVLRDTLDRMKSSFGPDQQKYIDDLVSQIDDNINLNKVDFEKQIDDMPGGSATGKGTSPNTPSYEDIRLEKVDDVIDHLKTHPQYQKLLSWWSVLFKSGNVNAEYVINSMRTKLGMATMNDLQDPKFIEKMEDMLEQTIIKLKSSSKKGERELGNGLENATKTVKGSKSLIRSIIGPLAYSLIGGSLLFTAIASMYTGEFYGPFQGFRELKDFIFSGGSEPSENDSGDDYSTEGGLN